ncbi:antitoxin CptB [Paracoccus isoporae]|uniref:FAD assembly factor SdhE n=1 Tax=Paracoccus isoporae TaxID=591205 RepID=A0A1G7AGZ5_9RHOB|nr:succinate dehydrogenase assembly factor 2 [Paracoccus isoporae]SDE13156.1 antitoxin CptB [Paracoccus isoporae]
METPENRLKRLRMRSWRRGMKEMDLILGPFADAELAGLTDALLADYEQLLAENDQDLYRWIVARSRHEAAGPEALSALLDRIAASAFGRFGPDDRHFTNMPAKTRAD